MEISHYTLAKAIELPVNLLHNVNQGTGAVMVVSDQGCLMASTLKLSMFIILQLKRKVGLSLTDEQVGRDIIIIQLSKEAASTNFSRSSLYTPTSVGARSSLQGVGRTLYSGHFLHVLSTSGHGPEERFVIPLSLTQGRLCHPHRSKALGSLTWLYPGQTIFI